MTSLAFTVSRLLPCNMCAYRLVRIRDEANKKGEIKFRDSVKTER